QLSAATPGAGILIIGDFNDTPGSPPLVATVGVEPDVYTDAAASAPNGEQWTFDFNGKLELIDHQMANPRLFGMLDPSSVVIPHDTGSASDHAPVIATYDVR